MPGLAGEAREDADLQVAEQVPDHARGSCNGGEPVKTCPRCKSSRVTKAHGVFKCHKCGYTCDKKEHAPEFRRYQPHNPTYHSDGRP